MATYNGNGVYLDIDGTAVHTYWRSITLTRSIGTEEATAGSSSTDIERLEKLKDTTGSITLVYDTTLAATHLPLIEPGTHTITVGPEGSAAGKPKHVQSVIFTEAPLEVAVEKPLVAWVIPFEGAAAPTTDMWNGGVWS